MRRSYVLLTLCYFLLAGILAGCGGGSGSPGSSGSEVTGIQIQSVTITSAAGPDFDVIFRATGLPCRQSDRSRSITPQRRRSHINNLSEAEPLE